MTTYGNLSLPELGSLIRQGVISCEELVQSVIADINSRNPWLNSFVRVTKQRAMVEAESARKELKKGLDRGPLHGIPYAVKDLFDVEGQPNSAGIPGLGGNMARRDAAVVRRLREAGAVLVGQTQSSPLAATIIGINHGYGTPHNPWKEEAYIPGGSSSGSAVAVSAGQIPFALGTDTGGSVRVPAALCGVVGFRPVPGTIDMEGCIPLAPSLDSVGSLCRSVVDTAAVYSILRGRPFSISGTVQRLRVALPQNVFYDGANPVIPTIVQDAAYSLRSQGVQTMTLQFPELDELLNLLRDTSLIAAEAYVLYREYIEDSHADWVLHWLRKAQAYTPARVEKFRLQHHRLASMLAERIEPFDAILVPTVPIPAPALQVCDMPEQHASFSALLSRNTLIGNLAGWSGITVPCRTLVDGLPVGIMVLSKPQKEDSVFALAQALEQVSPIHRKPEN